jgi:hypothetical protein
MARRANATTEGVVERSIALLSAFTQAMITDPSLGAEIPKGATLVLIPDDDPELAAHNQRLGEHAEAAGRPVYIRHIRTHELATR